MDSLNESSEERNAVKTSKQTQRIFWAIQFMKAIRGHIPNEEWTKIIQDRGLQVRVLRDETEETYLLPWSGSAIQQQSDLVRQTWELTVGVGSMGKLAWEHPWGGEENPPPINVLEILQAAARGGSFIPAIALDTPQGTPCLGYFFLTGDSIIIQAHDSIPIRADGLPDLRVLTTPRAEWDALGVEVVPPPVFQRLPTQIPQPTFEEAKIAAQAIADARTGRNWEGVEGDAALAHRPPDAPPIYVTFQPDPERAWWGTEVTHESLLSKLKQCGPEAVLLAYVILGELLREGTAQIEIDDLVKAVGWGPRSVADRSEKRWKVHQWLRIMAELKLGGRRRGTYRDPLTKEVLDLRAFGALFHIDEITLPAQRTLDGSETPLGFALQAGAWLKPHLGNRQILTEFGEVRRLADIPGGKPSGSWARGIGIALQQRWREQAARAGVGHAGVDSHRVVRFEPFTRRDLLGFLNFPPDVNEILASKNPERAVRYWREAVKLLREADVIGPGRHDYHELETLPETRKGWGEPWLDQPLQIRPGPVDTGAVAQIATAARKAKRALKRG